LKGLVIVSSLNGVYKVLILFPNGVIIEEGIVFLAEAVYHNSISWWLLLLLD
jgi:hypothetical protein